MKTRPQAGFTLIELLIGATITLTVLAGVTAGWIGLLAGSFVGDPFGLPSVALYFWTGVALVLASPVQRTRGSSVS